MYFIKRMVFFVMTGLLWSCSKNSDSATNTGTSGKGGSLAKFTIVGNFLYSVDNSSLYSFDISNALSPLKTNVAFIGSGIETIYPFKDRLFIGSANGMFIYSIANPSLPVKLGEAIHVRSCDPVVANDSVAFVTLKGGTRCGPAVSGLYIHDVKDLLNPVLKKVIQIETPEGLGLHDTTLYVCNNAVGLKIYSVADPYNPVERNNINDGNYYRDVIPFNDLLICMVGYGIILYDISDPNTPILVKRIEN